MALVLKLCLALAKLICSLSRLLSNPTRKKLHGFFGNVTLVQCCLIAEVQTVSDIQRKNLSTKLSRFLPRQ